MGGRDPGFCGGHDVRGDGPLLLYDRGLHELRREPPLVAGIVRVLGSDVEQFLKEAARLVEHPLPRQRTDRPLDHCELVEMRVRGHTPGIPCGFLTFAVLGTE